MGDPAQTFHYHRHSGGSSPLTLGQHRDLSDLLLLAALAVKVPLIAFGRPLTDGSWDVVASDAAFPVHTLHHLFDGIRGLERPVEVTDLDRHPGGQVLSLAPHSFRWAFAIPLTGSENVATGSLVGLDRGLRQFAVAEHRSVKLLARRMSARLAFADNPPVSAPAPVPVIVPSPGVGRPVPALSITARYARTISEDLMRTSDVASLFDVTDRTVLNWVAAGKLPNFRTFGGHLRFRESDILPLVGCVEPASPRPVGSRA